MGYSYKVGGKQVELERDPDLIAVRFKEPAPHSMRARVSSESGLSAFSERYEIPKEPYTVLPVAQTAVSRSERCEEVIRKLRGSSDVDRAAPVFHHRGAHVVATERVLAGIPDGATARRLADKYGCTIRREAYGEYELELPPADDPLEVASALSQEPGVSYAEPDFVSFGKRLARRADGAPQAVGPADPDSSRQYAIRITRAQQAWELQKGDPNVVIAILDEGVDTRHEDLGARVVASYDAIDDDAFQEPNAWDGHGTACAGLAAAIHDNERGIQGIGGGCSMQAIRIAYSPARGAEWRTSNSVIARGIDWAWEHGAHVLSNSWGGGAPSNAIFNAFERARMQGRDGKGCVLVIAAGNESGPVSFPGDQPNVLTVSASNEFDEFKTKQSRDGESWWGSNFGPEVDVAAPGVHNWTTDITADAGYTSSNYTDFNGTSSATPIVAGACGLILSANPELAEADVRRIIRTSAEKVGGLAYTEGRNDRFGYGRLDCLAAIQMALPKRTPYVVLHQARQAVPIKDKQTSALELAVGDDRPIAGVKVYLEIAHTWIGDLEVVLVPPGDGPSVTLHSRSGGGTDNIVRTYDLSTTPPLEALLGKRLPGTWKLRVTDHVNQDEGAILAFGVELTF